MTSPFILRMVNSQENFDILSSSPQIPWFIGYEDMNEVELEFETEMHRAEIKVRLNDLSNNPYPN